MKKQVLLLVAALSAASLNFVVAKNESLVCIDSVHIMQESKEGKILAEKLKAKINTYQELVKTSQQELASLQDEITKKSELLSKEALQEKTELLVSKRKDIEHNLTAKEEALRAELQREQVKLRETQLTVAKTLREEEKWGLTIDKNTPGVLFVDKSIDKTDEVLKKVDAMFDKTNSTKQQSTTVASNAKTAAATATEVKKA